MKNATENQTNQNGSTAHSSTENATMKTETITRNGRSAVARIPDRADVENLKVGAFAPDCFGELSRVTKIAYTGISQSGRAYVGYVTAMNSNDTPENGCGCSMSMLEGRLIRSVKLTGLLNSAECDELERELLPAGVESRSV